MSTLTIALLNELTRLMNQARADLLSDRNSIVRILDRLSELEKREHKFDYGDARGVVPLAEVWRDQEARLKKLEEQLSSEITKGILNVAQRVVTQAQRDERERQARWHATYNCVLSPVPDADVDEFGYAGRAHASAAAQADRAHGPLEAPKVEVNERGHYVVSGAVDVDRKIDDLAKHGRVSHPDMNGIAYVDQTWRENVEALVKAAEDAADLIDDISVAPEGAHSASIRAALVPFVRDRLTPMIDEKYNPKPKD